MTNEDYEFQLMDRIAKIQSISEQYNMEETYISFSGGKDSTMLHYLIDMALPNNKIPRVFRDTGIEYPQIRKFVKSLQSSDDRFQIIKPNKNIKATLEMVGYPFKSKQHSHNYSIYKGNVEKCDYFIKELKTNRKDIIDRVDKGISTIEDYNYLSHLPRGVETIVKYYFGLRQIPSNLMKKDTLEQVDEREREYYLPLSRLSLNA